jgi:putative lipoic acid-binding regulatory protein
MSPSPPLDKGSNGDGNGRQLSDRAREYDPFDALDYPCRFEIKAMGRNDNRFNALVQSIVTRHISQEDLLNSKVRPSREGKYVSITVIIRASGKQQIRAIYADLAQCPEVLMTL